MVSGYDGVCCHVCGNQVCQTCGCCQSSFCENCSCPDAWNLDE